MILHLPYFLSTEVMIAAGRVDQSNILQLYLQGLRIMGVLMVFPFGLIGACWGLVAATLVGTFVSQHLLHKNIGLGFKELFRACLPSVIVTALTVIPVITITLLFEQDESNFLPMLFGSSCATGIAWLVALKVVKHPFWQDLSVVIAKLRPS